MGASCQLVEKACYRKICRDGSRPIRNAPAGAVTHPHIWPRAAHKIAPNGARFSRYVVLLARQHGTVKTVPYKTIDRL